MIRVTRFDGSEFYVNADLIQVVESKPDTHIQLTNGSSYLVRESADEVVDRVVAFRRTIVGPEGGRRGKLTVLPRRSEA